MRLNNARRSKLREVLSILTGAESVVEQVCDKETDCLDNYPENLQSTDKFERMEDAVDSLNDALEKIGEAKEHIQYAIG